MPRAENRKKPTNLSGGGGKKQGGFQNNQLNGSGAAFGQAQSKKQELIEKMKKQLSDKKSEA